MCLPSQWKRFNFMNKKYSHSSRHMNKWKNIDFIKVWVSTWSIELPFIISSRHNHGWGTQKECLTPKSLTRHYFEWPLCLSILFFLVILFFNYILKFFMIEMVVIVCYLDDLNMSLNVLEYVSWTLSHYTILLKKNQ
jgi:hypothetical protein